MWDYIVNVLKNNKMFASLFDNPNEVIAIIKTRYSEPRRPHHGVKHLYKLFKLNQNDFMIIVSAFHDIVYDPKKSNNEEESVKLFKSLVKATADKKLVSDVIEVINDTKTGEGKSILSIDFQDYDRWYLNNDKSNKEVEEIEKDIRSEYNYVDFNTYKKKRIEFLKSQVKKNSWGIDKHIKFVEGWIKE